MWLNRALPAFKTSLLMADMYEERVLLVAFYLMHVKSFLLSSVAEHKNCLKWSGIIHCMLYTLIMFIKTVFRLVQLNSLYITEEQRILLYYNIIILHCL